MSQGPLNPNGIDGTGIVPPTGGRGVRGWLSGIYKLLSGTINVSGSFTPAYSTTGTESSVSATTTPSTVLLAANTSRKGATIYQDDVTGGSILYVALNSTCTTSAYTLKMSPMGYYEVPYGYTGIITGVWSAATGNARIVEMT